MRASLKPLSCSSWAVPSASAACTSKLIPSDSISREAGQVSRYARQGWIQNELVPNGIAVRYLGSIGSVSTPPGGNRDGEAAVPSGGGEAVSWGEGVLGGVLGAGSGLAAGPDGRTRLARARFEWTALPFAHARVREGLEDLLEEWLEDLLRRLSAHVLRAMLVRLLARWEAWRLCPAGAATGVSSPRASVTPSSGSARRGRRRSRGILNITAVGVGGCGDSLRQSIGGVPPGPRRMYVAVDVCRGGRGGVRGDRGRGGGAARRSFESHGAAGAPRSGDASGCAENHAALRRARRLRCTTRS